MQLQMQMQCIVYYSDSIVVYWGPYFNGLKRKSEAQNAITFVGGSMAMLLLWRRINTFCAQRNSKMGWSEVA